MNFMQLLKTNGSDFTEIKSKTPPVAMVAPELKHTENDTEITRTCAVSGCEDFKHLDAENLFPFPDDPDQRQIWTNLTGRNNWTPTDYSYICIQHFSVDSFECNAENNVVLTDKAVPSLKLPKHVLEIEYIDETLEESDYDDEEYHDEYEDHEDGHIQNGPSRTTEDNGNILKLFTEVQRMQRQAVSIKDKLKRNIKLHNQQSRYLKRLKETVELKKQLLNQKNKKKTRILLSLQDKIKEDTNGLVLAMPVRHTDDLKDFALSIYKYSPQSYIYVRNTLRTMLPSTDVLESWLNTGYKPKNVMAGSNSVKVVAEQTPTELSCKIMLQ